MHHDLKGRRSPRAALEDLCRAYGTDFGEVIRRAPGTLRQHEYNALIRVLIGIVEVQAGRIEALEKPAASTSRSKARPQPPKAEETTPAPVADNENAGGSGDT